MMFEEEHLFTAKNILFSSLLLVIVSCGSLQRSSKKYHDIAESSKCHTKRAAIDLGSGSTKLVVGLVNTCKGLVEGILFEAQRAVPLKEALQASKENEITPSMIQKLSGVFEEFKYMADHQGASDIKAVATSAFRTADNGEEAAEIITNNSGIPLTIISQKDEARFAYYAALSKTKTMKLSKKSPVAVWDIGGGSMQITKPLADGSTKVALLKTASVPFKNLVLKELYPDGTKTPNPLTEERALRSMDLARFISKQEFSRFGNLKGYQVIGVGGVHYYSIGGQFKKTNRIYNQSTLLSKLLERSKLSDKEIDSKYAVTDVTNLALVLGFMQTLKVDQVRPLKINMAHGLLINKDFWN